VRTADARRRLAIGDRVCIDGAPHIVIGFSGTVVRLADEAGNVMAVTLAGLPYDRLLSVDERLEHAAAKPVIVPDTIVIDHGSVFVSANFRVSCRHLGISIQPAHLASGAEKPHIERAFGSLASLFCQFVSGYLGRNPDWRGRGIDGKPLWPVLELQELLDEWLIALPTGRTTACATRSISDGEHPRG
jgi:hypothetical protein